MVKTILLFVLQGTFYSVYQQDDEMLKCRSEIYELKESQLRLDQQSFNSSISAGNLSETGPNSGVHGSNCGFQ